MRRPKPPMPATVKVTREVRDMAVPGVTFVPVARVEFGDILGDLRELDLGADMAFKLARQLLDFIDQVGVAR